MHKIPKPTTRIKVNLTVFLVLMSLSMIGLMYLIALLGG